MKSTPDFTPRHGEPVVIEFDLSFLPGIGEGKEALLWGGLQTEDLYGDEDQYGYGSVHTFIGFTYIFNPASIGPEGWMVVWDMCLVLADHDTKAAKELLKNALTEISEGLLFLGPVEKRTPGEFTQSRPEPWGAEIIIEMLRGLDEKSRIEGRNYVNYYQKRGLLNLWY